MPDSPNEPKGFSWLPILSLGLAVLAAILLYLKGGDPMDHLKVVAGYTILILVFFYGLMILIAMARGTINLKYLVSDADTGHASMARFQLLIFTFVIALSLFLIIVGNNKQLRFPEIPNQVLTLLGISASTYAVGKHLQNAGREDGGATGGEAQGEEKKDGGQ